MTISSLLKKPHLLRCFSSTHRWCAFVVAPCSWDFLSRLLVVFLSVFVLVSAWADSAGAVTALEVIDGDTLVTDGKKGGERVRLIGVDTPEIQDDHGRNARTAEWMRIRKKNVDLYAVEARAAAAEWVKGQELKLVYDSANESSKNLDSYGRTLAYVCRESDGSCLSEHLLAGGYGLVYRRFNFERKRHFFQIEKQARTARKGLWQYQKTKKSPKKKN